MKKARPVKVGSHYLHYHLNDLNAEKSYSFLYASPVYTLEIIPVANGGGYRYDEVAYCNGQVIMTNSTNVDIMY